MNKKRAQFTYKLIGKITHKNQRTNPKYTQYFYQLNIACENQPDIKKIFVFKDKVPPPIWQMVDEGNCFQQKYRFFCRNYSGCYYLVDWEEIEHEE
ncbi:MAG: hypothetical protein MRECE_33c023 [Mycoplasmataceae bacterium CE_OT135]|nr:MAG: hypothetical protein MRECE_33c023 [Mycoplasmataceae bacterium CE_OT135]